jgi:phage terminase large subunit
MTALVLEVPEKLEPLLHPARYKAAWGGRGGAKSHFFAEQLVVRCYAKQTRAVCIREVQESIKDSVRQLLVDKIQKLGLGNVFDVLESEIRGPRGSLIIFKGMQNYNAENIKSLENFDIAWVEEAQTLSEKSLRLLRPTIRKDGSELWFSWNPVYETDAIDQFLRGETPPEDSIVVEVNWRDNPWFPKVLKDEMDHDRIVDAEMARHVWDGGYQIITEGAYYAHLIAQAEKEGRCGAFPHDPRKLVRTGWDIGVDDHSAIWFIQDDGINADVIDYYEASGIGAPQLVEEALPELWTDQVRSLQSRVNLGRGIPYRYGEHFLPHDVKAREWGGGAKTRVQTLMELGLKDICKGAAQGPAERINAVRAILPVMRFNTANPRVKIGLNRVRRYSRRYNDSLQTFTTSVLHDINSHAADALGEWAVNAGIFAPKQVAAVAPPKPTGYLPPLPMPSNISGLDRGRIKL